MEVREFQVDSSLSPATDKKGEEIQLDIWWSAVIDKGAYPTLTKMAKALMSCFHGPQVEGAFNTMGDVLNVKSCRMDISTYSSIQTVKYAIRTKKTSAIGHFARKDILMDPVNGQLCLKMRTSSKRYREELEQREVERESKRQKLAIRAQENTSKAEAKRRYQAAHKCARKAHVRAIKAKLKSKA